MKPPGSTTLKARTPSGNTLRFGQIFEAEDQTHAMDAGESSLMKNL
jgi:hypothetical protein